MKLIYLVVQTQTTEDLDYYPIYALTSKKRAEEYAQKLNKMYAYGVKLDDRGNFKYVDDLVVHYYNVLPMKLNEELIGSGL